LLQLRLFERALLDERFCATGDRVDGVAAGDEADVDAVERRQQRDEAVDRARPAALMPRVTAGAGHGEADADAADGVGDDVVEAVALERDRLLRRQRRRRVPRAAEGAEPLLADGEDHGERRVQLRPELLDDVDRERDRERVVAEAGADEPATALEDLVRDVLAEDGVEVREQRQPVRRRAERPDQVADLVRAVGGAGDRTGARARGRPRR
jgi:hypothetical protein